ncbi:hypothetical protein BDP55DRAFT_223087 [Colletotrichum godetiae]|uniref:Uncharacterized protein n=1 Tax=Colletotrichum godetiae TaxID=1209918 RepID=A0AAJ0AJ35_9PEZI|nr:uncharacterized protein BDP55DRAFT_223087 [Colletotrichum godetiae]KAK1673378.1 hypothetical protein BDP55DRAFT_223087 [Colletotrichum godetiae]
MWDWQSYVTGSIIRIVPSGLVVLPALGFSVLILRKPGAKHDHTRRWVDFTKVAFGLWSITAVIFPIRLLRSGAESDDSNAYRVGKKVVLGLSALITLVAVAIFACIVAAAVLLEILPGRDRYVPGDWDNAIRLGFAAEYMGVINIGFLLAAALGLAGYAFVSFKAARGSPTQTAATLLLIAVSLWLITRLWNFISCVMAVTGYYWGYGSSYVAAAVIDAILIVWSSFAALMVLYVLASNNAYSLSRLHYQEGDDEQRVWDERTQST